MLELVIPVVFTMILTAMLLNLWRILRGPTITDRVIGLDTMYINSIALLAVLDIWFDNDIYLEAAILIAMMGFVSTLAVCKFLLRGDIIE
ncbi:MAG: K+/H+ antiporter subunit F [Chromatiales bacterium]|jgi:multicomponent K+:H+ antiporter subunit F